MSDDLRQQIEQTLAELNQSYDKLTVELDACRDLASSVREFHARLQKNERTFLETLERWGRIRDDLQAKLDAEDGEADWWKHGPADDTD